jgi:drug/metabolite transporter (DMT)-like permease
MIYLVLVVLLNALLAVIFKLFDRFKINHVQAIVFNYWVCILTGSLFLGEFPIRASSCSQPWFPFALLMGVGFISVFNLFAYCTKYEGITAATVANKLSLVIPVVCSVFLYREHLNLPHVLAILIAFPAVYLAAAATTTKQDVIAPKQFHFGWTALLFVGSGLLDTLMKFVQQKYLHSQALQAVYTIHLFAVAGSIGLFVLAYLKLRNHIQFSWRNVLGGIVLGIPNYFSIYFFIRMLNSNCLKSSALIPLSNIGVLFASTLFAIVFFQERMNAKRWIGLLLSLVVIVLLATA